MILTLVLLVPLAAALLAKLARSQRLLVAVHLIASLITFGLGLALVMQVWDATSMSTLDGFLRVDALSALMVLLISGLGSVAGVYAVHYVGAEQRQATLTFAQGRRFYALLHLFLFAMLLAVTTDNLGVMWVAVEGTTLATVFLVNLHGTRASLEAAYKYLLISSVGIVLAFVGTIVLALAGRQSVGADLALSWSALHAADGSLPRELVRFAFLFVLVGYGTKTGLAPMHTWLPDAHSEAPAPISALMSGVLLNVGLYAVLRFKIITDAALGPAFTQRLLLGMGLVSLAVAAAFLISQRNYKRMLAYSSVEHMGIICLGLGFGGFWGTFGAFLHIINHALGKSLLFLTSGNILLAYHTTEIGRVRGLLRALPLTGGAFLLGTLALIGLPPFGPFISEFLIFRAGLAGAAAWVAVAGIVLLAIIFAGMLGSVNAMLYGPAPEQGVGGERGRWLLAPLAINVGLLLVLGVTFPPVLTEALTRIVHLLGA